MYSIDENFDIHIFVTLLDDLLHQLSLTIGLLLICA